MILTVGTEYTVAGVSLTNLVLAEIQPQFFHADGSPVGFTRTKFRPVVDRATDITIFREMLSPSKEQVTA